jgi:hypothetical protein
MIVSTLLCFPVQSNPVEVTPSRPWRTGTEAGFQINRVTGKNPAHPMAGAALRERSESLFSLRRGGAVK